MGECPLTQVKGSPCGVPEGVYNYPSTRVEE